MGIRDGSISPALAQSLSRVLYRMGFSMRKESISQTVPLNWLSFAVEVHLNNNAESGDSFGQYG
jgi:hypothetical protein